MAARTTFGPFFSVMPAEIVLLNDAARLALGFQKIVVGVQHGVAEIIEDVPVEGIGAAAGNQ